MFFLGGVFLFSDLNDINFIWISAEVSDDKYIRARVTRQEFFNTGAIVYEVPPLSKPTTTQTQATPPVPSPAFLLYPFPPGLNG